MSYDEVKLGVLGTLPDRLRALIDRADNEEDRTLLEQTLDRLDALAGDFAYRELFRLPDVPQPAEPTLNLLIDERTGETSTLLAHLPTPGEPARAQEITSLHDQVESLRRQPVILPAEIERLDGDRPVPRRTGAGRPAPVGIGDPGLAAVRKQQAAATPSTTHDVEA